jgi:hypothetical protein
VRLTPLLVVLNLALVAPVGRVWAQDNTAPKTADVDKLVSDLGADDFNKRDEAQKKLEAMGKKALPALEKAEKESADAEIRARAHEAILAIKKGLPSGGQPPTNGGDRDTEREGPPLPPERRFAPRDPGADRGDRRDDPNGGEWDDFMKLFEGQDSPMMKELPKIFEHLQKQMRDLDKEYEKELKRPRDNGNGGGMRVFRFRTPTAVEMRLGLQVNPSPPALQAQLDLPATDSGLLVEELAPNGPAWKAGLKQYDVILSIDGKSVRGPEDLKGLGEKDAKVEVMRKAKKETLLVHAQPANQGVPSPKPEKKDEPQIRKF